MKKEIVGTVVKVTDDEIVLMTKEGTFKNVVRPDNEFPLIGQSYVAYSTKSSVSWMKYVSVAVILMFSIMLYSIFSSEHQDPAYLVAIDVNPSIELELNEDFEVIRMIGNNDEGETIIENLSLNRSFSEAVMTIHEELEQKGYIEEGTPFTMVTSAVSLSTEHEANLEQIERDLEEASENKQVNIDYMHGSEEDLSESSEKNISLNKYLLGKRLAEESKVNDASEVIGESVSQLLDKLKQDESNPNPNEVQSNNKKSSQVEELPNQENKQENVEKPDPEQQQDNKPEHENRDNRSSTNQATENKEEDKPSNDQNEEKSESGNAEKSKAEDRGSNVSENETQDDSHNRKNENENDKETDDKERQESSDHGEEGSNKNHEEKSNEDAGNNKDQSSDKRP
ncbi:hypothetical protein J2R98_001935 [Alkalibacillus filiformis]|uniref:RsgI N-terminal anti-sigma domain-containing protein n=1 Tax=Alkalibacillus filiformis TaxID=200990 RepID=A0ABU0DUG3_9BACI|nr:hypothetical protein [Alkalibacillus filiformis]MDQ0352101.1 hypothetical protein [Alkalibacillus filiformis]